MEERDEGWSDEEEVDKQLNGVFKLERLDLFGGERKKD